MTWLGWLNIVVLQWLFLRLAKVVDEDSLEVVGYRLLVGVIPGSGWGTPYRKVF